MSDKSPDITFYCLGASRAIRIAWLLEELGLEYNLVASPRAKNGLAPPEFKAKIPNPLGKSPTIKDGSVVVTESGAIVEYLCENYDKSHKILPTEPHLRAKAREWIHAAEGTFMVHSMPILYTRWRMPEGGKQYQPELEKNLQPNITNDFKWLESELQHGKKFLIGDEPTAADIMMQFGVQFMYERKMGAQKDGTYPAVEKWLERTLEWPTYKKAVEKTGFTLDGDFFK